MGNCSSSPSVQQQSTARAIIDNSIKAEQKANPNQSREEIPDTNNIQINSSLEEAKHEFTIRYAQPLVEKAKIEDFELKRTIGMGSFARVILVKHSNHFLVLKIMEKQHIVELGQVEHVLSEKCILQAINSLEWTSGGDMFSNLLKSGKYTEEKARFYAAQIVLALEYLHYLNIIFRNIKSEDILFTADGYLKLTDFGFAKVTKDRTYTLCGTPEYLAPEIITGMGHHKGVDYWALGVLINEMTTGSTPFCADDPMQVYLKIMKGTFEIPDYWSSDVSDLIKKFLEVRPLNRYGCLKNGINDIKNHKWFSSIDWITIAEKRLQAPFIPEDGKDYYDQYDEKPLTFAETTLYSTEFENF